mgnify:CR=1 FL=1
MLEIIVGGVLLWICLGYFIEGKYNKVILGCFPFLRSGEWI